MGKEKKAFAVRYQKFIQGVLGKNFLYGPFTDEEAKAFLTSRDFKPSERPSIWLKSEGEFKIGIAEIMYLRTS